ncbi:hypothetical protein B566_EDAN006635 [Ephemera danica]|nr:hypothetical protein B566_EDAN006635 [Ephemera danica]
MQRPPFWRVPKNRPDPDDDKPGTWTLHEAKKNIFTIMSRRFSNPSLPQKVKVTLVRDGFNQPWGFRLAGGVDVGAPLTILRALAGTPSEGELKPGDVVCKIGEHDARHLTHNDAQTLFRNTGNSINVVVERGGSAPNKSAGPMSPPLPPPVATLPKPPVAGGVATPFAMASAPAAAPAPTYTPLQVNTTPAPPAAAFTNNVLSPKSPAASNDYSKPSPIMQSLPVTVFPPPLPGFTPMSGQPRRPVTPQPFSGMYDETSPEFIDNQHRSFLQVDTQSQAALERKAMAGVYVRRHHASAPSTNGFANHYMPNDAETLLWPYRTTPLVLPGAKTKREVPITSYLRHHPNPAVRAAPHHFDPQVDVLMKQKVVHQFNSPIALYSDQNIVESVQAAQSGVTPYKGKKTLYYDPAKSETFKALKDSELGDTVTEVPTPIQTKVFTPQKHIQPPLHQMQRFYPLGDEKIHQSYSFRRLMNEVLGESEF